jgi:hypothetical protein
MRLIKADDLKIHEFVDIQVAPPFAILSHTWGNEECSLQAMENLNVTARAGYTKIKYCCQQALKDGLEWVWIDT